MSPLKMAAFQQQSIALANAHLPPVTFGTMVLLVTNM